MTRLLMKEFKYPYVFGQKMPFEWWSWQWRLYLQFTSLFASCLPESIFESIWSLDIHQREEDEIDSNQGTHEIIMQRWWYHLWPIFDQVIPQDKLSASYIDLELRKLLWWSSSFIASECICVNMDQSPRNIHNNLQSFFCTYFVC